MISTDLGLYSPHETFPQIHLCELSSHYDAHSLISIAYQGILLQPGTCCRVVREGIKGLKFASKFHQWPTSTAFLWRWPKGQHYSSITAYHFTNSPLSSISTASSAFSPLQLCWSCLLPRLRRSSPSLPSTRSLTSRSTSITSILGVLTTMAVRRTPYDFNSWLSWRIFSRRWPHGQGQRECSLRDIESRCDSYV